MAITITIDEEDFKDMLVERVRHWTDDQDTIELFEEYYDNMVYGGCFEGTNRSIAEIVDNDYCNNTSVITEEEYNKAREEYIQESMESDGYGEDNRPTIENYAEQYSCEYIRMEDGSIKFTDSDDQEDFEQELADFDREKQEALKQYEEDTPTFEDLEVGEVPSESSDFLDGYYIEAKTSSAILVLY